MATNDHDKMIGEKTLYLLSFCVIVIATFFAVPVFHPYRDYVLNLMPFSVRDHVIHGRVLTKEELAKFTGEGGGKVYLGILGEVFDVTKGKRHYGPGGGYHFFAGKDGTRAFVSGDFTDKGLIEDISGLSSQDYLGLEEWLDFYRKDYTYIGKLIGHFYDEYGNHKEAVTQYKDGLAKAKKERAATEDDRKRFPPCNSEYKQGAGRRLWCSNLSGGIKRDWAGVPRQYFRRGKSDPRCACVKDSGPPSDSPDLKNHNDRGDLDNPNMKEYEGCEPKSFSCSFPE